jgi:hypothetical protein
MAMADDSALLQANATVVAGILIFLTLAPFSKTVVAKIKEKKNIVWTVYLTLISLIISVLAILLWPLLPGMMYNVLIFAISRIAFVLGLMGVLGSIYVILHGIPKWENAGSGHGKVKDEGL